MQSVMNPSVEEHARQLARASTIRPQWTWCSIPNRGLGCPMNKANRRPYNNCLFEVWGNAAIQNSKFAKCGFTTINERLGHHCRSWARPDKLNRASMPPLKAARAVNKAEICRCGGRNRSSSCSTVSQLAATENWRLIEFSFDTTNTGPQWTSWSQPETRLYQGAEQTSLKRVRHLTEIANGVAVHFQTEQ